jgi:hypothetical protein
MEKIKHFIESQIGKDILTVLIVILVGASSFGLGRLSKTGSDTQLKVYNASQEANVATGLQNVVSTVKTSTTGNFFASTRGSKYYPVNCSAGKTIKQENRVYFETGEEAQKAGYELSSSC